MTHNSKMPRAENKPRGQNPFNQKQRHGMKRQTENLKVFFPSLHAKQTESEQRNQMCSKTIVRSKLPSGNQNTLAAGGNEDQETRTGTADSL